MGTWAAAGATSRVMTATGRAQCGQRAAGSARAATTSTTSTGRGTAGGTASGVAAAPGGLAAAFGAVAAPRDLVGGGGERLPADRAAAGGGPGGRVHGRTARRSCSARAWWARIR